jgi:hypothetical protein
LTNQRKDTNMTPQPKDTQEEPISQAEFQDYVRAGCVKLRV